MPNTNTLKNLDVNGVYATGMRTSTKQQIGILVDILGHVVTRFTNLGHTRLQRGVVYDIENVVYDGTQVFLDDETAVHHYENL